MVIKFSLAGDKTSYCNVKYIYYANSNNFFILRMWLVFLKKNHMVIEGDCDSTKGDISNVVYTVALVVKYGSYNQKWVFSESRLTVRDGLIVRIGLKDEVCGIKCRL